MHRYFISFLTHFWQIRFGLHMVIPEKMKTHENVIINCNFINVFLPKACSIIVSRAKCISMAGRAGFSRLYLFFSQSIFSFFVSCFYASGKMLIFFMSFCFFRFAMVCFKKQQKKNSEHSMGIQRLANLSSLWVGLSFPYIHCKEHHISYLGPT